MPRVREYSFAIIMAMEFQNQLVSTRVSALPVAPDSEGTDSNPFTLDALAVFIIRVLQGENHPVFIFLLVFWHFYNAVSLKDLKFKAMLEDVYMLVNFRIKEC